MPGIRCAVAVCKNGKTMTGKDPSTLHIIYHRFPLDEQQRKLWVKRTRRDGEFKASSARICSVHFTSEDYERDLKAELMGLPARRVRPKYKLAR